MRHAAACPAHLHQAILCDVVGQVGHNLDLTLRLLLLLLASLLLCRRLLRLLLLGRGSWLLHVLLPLGAAIPAAAAAAAVGAIAPLLLRLLPLLRQLGSVLVHAGQQLRQVLPQNVATNQPQLGHLQAGGNSEHTTRKCQQRLPACAAASGSQVQFPGKIPRLDSQATLNNPAAVTRPAARQPQPTPASSSLSLITPHILLLTTAASKCVLLAQLTHLCKLVCQPVGQGIVLLHCRH